MKTKVNVQVKPRARHKSGPLPIGEGIVPDPHSRESNILLLLVDSHIASQAPVSSLHITKQPNIHLSPATVRAICADLESQGYLFSPHHSAGRIPTEKAYRYYVDHLSPPSRNDIKDQEECYIQEKYLQHNLSVESILSTTCHILSILTDYATIILWPSTQGAVLKHLEIIDMGADEILVIFVTRSGRVLSSKVFIEERLAESTLRLVSRQLNQNFKGMELSEVRSGLSAQAKTNSCPHYRMLACTIEKNFDLIVGSENIYKEGFERLYSHLKQETLDTLNRLNNNNVLSHTIWKRSKDKEGLDVFISQNCTDDPIGLSGVSIVSGSYKMGEKPVGLVSIIGPSCMNYRRTLSLVGYVRHVVSNMITRLSN